MCLALETQLRIDDGVNWGKLIPPVFNFGLQEYRMVRHELFCISYPA